MAIVLPLFQVIEQDLFPGTVLITRCRLSLKKIFVSGVESHHHASIKLVVGNDCDYLARDCLQGVKDATNG